MNPLLQSWMIRTRAEMDADPFRQFNLLPFDGCCRVRIVRAEATVTKWGELCASLVLEPEGEGPEGRGVRFFWQVPVEGMNMRGLPNVIRFGELLLSRGMSDQGMRQALNMRFDKAANLAKYLQRTRVGKDDLCQRGASLAHRKRRDGAGTQRCSLRSDEGRLRGSLAGGSDTDPLDPGQAGTGPIGTGNRLGDTPAPASAGAEDLDESRTQECPEKENRSVKKLT